MAGRKNIRIGLVVLAFLAGFAGTTFAGRIIAWGTNLRGELNVPAGHDVVAIACGSFHSIALKSDGSLAAAGVNYFGQCDVPAGNDFVAVAGGRGHSLALKSDGSIVGWGENWYGQANSPGRNFVAIAGGSRHSLALRSYGSLRAWGSNDKNQCIVPSGTFIAIACGQYHNVAVKSDGSLKAWGGDNRYGQLNVPGGNNFVKVACGWYHSIALRSDGSLVGWGMNYLHECNVPKGNDFVAIAAGLHHSLVLRSDGSLVAWGGNYHGQCNAPSGNDFVDVAAGSEFSIALEATEPVTLVGLEIVGSEEVEETTEAQYTALASYDDGTTEEVTVSTIWSVEPGQYASFSDYGLLYAEAINEPQDVIIYAEYSEAGVTLQAEMTVRICLHVPRTLRVPAEYATINEAVENCLDGDVVLVADGTYGPCNIDGGVDIVSITIRSENGPENCIIDGDGGNAIKFYRVETKNCIFEGFTLTNSQCDTGAIFCIKDSNPTIKNCIIINNGNLIGEANYKGTAGIRCFLGSSPTILNCLIVNNYYCAGSGAVGGAIYCSYSCNPTIKNCTIVDNSYCDKGGAIYCDRDCNIEVINCILWSNSPYEIWVESKSSAYISYSDVQNYLDSIYIGYKSTLEWGQGNIDRNPLFVEPNATNYHLREDSFCINAGDPDYVAGPNETDIDGQPRVWDGRVDMGAYEFVPTLEVAMRFTPQALKVGSKGKWVKAHFVLPEGFGVEDVDANTPVVIESLGIESEYMNIFVNEDGLVEIEAAFEQAEFCNTIGNESGSVEVTIGGQLTTGQKFYGTDRIRVINKR